MCTFCWCQISDVPVSTLMKTEDNKYYSKKSKLKTQKLEHVEIKTEYNLKTTDLDQKISCFKCKTCGKTFKQSGHRNRHDKTHAPDKSHKCDQCGDRFHRTDELRAHSRIRKTKSTTRSSQGNKSNRSRELHNSSTSINSEEKRYNAPHVVNVSIGPATYMPTPELTQTKGYTDVRLVEKDLIMLRIFRDIAKFTLVKRHTNAASVVKRSTERAA